MTWAYGNPLTEGRNDMRKRASRGLIRATAGGAAGVLGLALIALATSSPAYAAVNPGGTTLGTTVGNPINASATIPTAITVDISANSGGASFGTIQPGSHASVNLSDTVTSNDPNGYVTSIIGTNDGANWLAGQPTVSCPESIQNVAYSGAGGTPPTASSPITTYPNPVKGVSRTVSTWGNKAVIASGAFGNTSGDADANYVPSPTGSTLGTASFVPVELSGNASAVTASAPAFNTGLTSVSCAFSGAFNSSDYLAVDTFGLTSLPWAALTASGTAGTNAFTENDTEGGYTDVSGTYVLDTNPVILDTKSGVSGTAGSLTNTTDSYTDGLTLTVPGNQAAGAYQAALVETIWGN